MRRKTLGVGGRKRETKRDTKSETATERERERDRTREANQRKRNRQRQRDGQADAGLTQRPGDTNRRPHSEVRSLPAARIYPTALPHSSRTLAVSSLGQSEPSTLLLLGPCPLIIRNNNENNNEPRGSSSGSRGSFTSTSSPWPPAPGGRLGARRQWGGGPRGLQRRRAGTTPPGSAPPPRAAATHDFLGGAGAGYGAVQPHERGQRLRHPVGDHGHGAQHGPDLEQRHRHRAPASCPAAACRVSLLPPAAWCSVPRRPAAPGSRARAGGRGRTSRGARGRGLQLRALGGLLL